MQKLLLIIDQVKAEIRKVIAARIGFDDKRLPFSLKYRVSGPFRVTTLPLLTTEQTGKMMFKGLGFASMQYPSGQFWYLILIWNLDFYKGFNYIKKKVIFC